MQQAWARPFALALRKLFADGVNSGSYVNRTSFALSASVFEAVGFVRVVKQGCVAVCGLFLLC